MKLLSSRLARTLLAGLALLALASPSFAGTLDRDNSSQTNWLWYTGQSASQVNTHRNKGYRIVSLSVDTTSPLTFTVALVRNSGSYARSSRAWYYGTPSYIASKRNGRRITALAPYVINNTLYLAAAFVDNTGSHNKGWNYYYGSLSSISSSVTRLKQRIVDLGTYVLGGKRYYTAVAVSNTGTDARGWWWYLGATPAYLVAQQLKNNARLIDIEYIGSGLYNAVMVNGSKMPHAWWHYNITSSNLAEKINQTGSRVISAQRVGSRYNVCLINNSNALTTQVGDIMRKIPAVTGIYMKQVGGPVLVWINGDRVYEPASSLKTLHHVHAMRQVAQNKIRLSTQIFSYVGSPTACPKTTFPRTIETLEQVLSPMMKNSDNTRTLTIERHFGRSNLNATAKALGMTRTSLNHSIGCGLPPNALTLEDAGKLFEAVATGYLGSSASDFYRLMANYSLNTVIDQEGAKLNIPAKSLSSFKSHVIHVAKGGSYGVSGKQHRSHVGYMRLPFWVNKKVELRGYVYGNFINDATSTTNFSLFSTARGEMRNEMIRQALQSWKNAQFVGSTAKLGTGCIGTGGRLAHDSVGTPEIGQTQYFRLQRGAPSSFAVLQLGFSHVNWGPIRLPFDLTPFGATGCKIYNEPVISWAIPTTSAGSASFALKLPSARSFIGTFFFTQYMCLDKPANKLGLTYSNGLQTIVGGWRQ